MTYEWTMGNWSNYAIFPCKANTKIPATKRGFKDALFNQDVLEIERQGYNVGLALEPSNLIAIDCDVDEKKGYNGLETLAKLEEKLGKLPNTLTQETPRGGKHFIFSSSGIINPIGKIGKDIDIKFKGYIMIMPSKINNKAYCIVNGTDENADFIIAKLPQPWLNFLNKDTNSKRNQAQKMDFSSLERKIYKNIDIERLFNNCAFLRHCRDNAEILSEPEWHTMITVLAQIKNSDELIHTLSAPYPKYNYAETQVKIYNARRFGHPQSCKYISETYSDICQNCNYATNVKDVNYVRYK